MLKKQSKDKKLTACYSCIEIERINRDFNNILSEYRLHFVFLLTDRDIQAQ